MLHQPAKLLNQAARGSADTIWGPVHQQDLTGGPSEADIAQISPQHEKHPKGMSYDTLNCMDVWMLALQAATSGWQALHLQTLCTAPTGHSWTAHYEIW